MMSSVTGVAAPAVAARVRRMMRDFMGMPWKFAPAGDGGKRGNALPAADYFGAYQRAMVSVARSWVLSSLFTLISQLSIAMNFSGPWSSWRKSNIASHVALASNLTAREMWPGRVTGLLGAGDSRVTVYFLARSRMDSRNS